ncbi:MAG TPA: DUF1788 domain-containing protein [Clostridiaceae bacterium]|nr:DUF1788 domain-containing protein [Clostridiaceae bacterium]
MLNSLYDRLDQVEAIIRQSSFRENKGLGNEVGYYIFDYDPRYELEVRRRIDAIYQRCSESTDAFNLCIFDLYDIIITILEEKSYLEKCYKLEQRRGFDKVSNAVANLMRITSTDGLIVEYICERLPEQAILFITGVGKCYPIIRAHTILNNLHQVIDDVPVVMFYPGKYDGQELILFNQIKDDNYYRAFTLVE